MITPADKGIQAAKKDVSVRLRRSDRILKHIDNAYKELSHAIEILGYCDEDVTELISQIRVAKQETKQSVRDALKIYPY